MTWTDDYFGEVIFAYTDADALEDGQLIDISSLGMRFEQMAVNRITQALLAEMADHYPTPDGAQVDLEAMASAFDRKLRGATGEGRLRQLPGGVWLVENEVDGWTLMLPSDY